MNPKVKANRNPQRNPSCQSHRAPSGLVPAIQAQVVDVDETSTQACDATPQLRSFPSLTRASQETRNREELTKKH